MDAVVNAIYAGFQAFLGAGAYVMLPVIITILGIVFGLKIGKAFKSGVTIAIGFAGINLVVQLMKDQLGPAAKAMVTNFGVQLDVLDVGWGAIASVAWASPIVPFIVFEVLLIIIGLLVINKTNTMDVDIWNYHHLLTAGVLTVFVTGNFVFGLLASGIMAVVTFKLADWSQPFVSHYFGIPNVTLPTASATSSMIIAAPVNWIFDHIPGIRDIDFSLDSAKKYLGFFGEPWMLGLILGCLIGGLAQYDVAKLFTLGVYMAAVMVLMPRMTALFVEGLMPVSDAARKFCMKRFKGRQLNIGLDAAVVVGNDSVITLALLMTPITLLLAVILPGNHMLPFSDLAVLTFRVALVVAICRGNMFRSLIISCLVIIAILYGGTAAAPYMTQLAINTGLDFEGQLIASMTGPSLTQTAIIFWSFVKNPYVLVPIVVAAFLGIWWFVEKKVGMDKIEAYAAQCDEDEE